jgi:hypothetical protein
MNMGEVLKAEWFDIADKARDGVCAWMHEDYLPALQSAPGVAWVGHYEIVALPDRPYIEGAPRRKETKDPAVAPGWQNVVLTAAVSPDVFFGPGNPVDALREAHAAKLAAFENYRSAVFIEEQVVSLFAKSAPATNLPTQTLATSSVFA